MKIIVAISGGEIGRPGYPVETTEIDKEIIKLSGKKRANLLFIPTASSDAEGYVETVKKHFGERLGCRVDVLYLINSGIVKKEIGKKIFSSDIIYVGGGNTLKMLKVWKKNGVDKILKRAWKRKIVISGLSAGAVCWFKYFNSDSKKFIKGKNNYQLIKLKGLGWLNASFCPHYDTEEKRKRHLKKMMLKTPGIALAVDNCCAVIIENDKYQVISSKRTANAYKVFWLNKKFYQIKIKKVKLFKPLGELLKKTNI